MSADHEHVCAYCGEDVLTGREREEHPIPAALGSGLTIRCVCDPCNEWANKNIDQPILDDEWMKVFRADYDIRDHRRGAKDRPVPHPFRHGFTDEGVRVTADSDWKPKLGSKIIDNEDGTMRIIAGSMEEAERLIERATKQAATSGHKLEITSVEQGQDRPTIHANVSTNTALWLRASAKMLLGIGAAVYPPAWRVSSAATQLRRWMRQNRPSDDEGNELGALPTRVSERLGLQVIVRPPEHLAMFSSTSRGTQCLLLLFGDLAIPMVVDDGTFSVPTTVLLMDPKDPEKCRQTTLPELIAERSHPD